MLTPHQLDRMRIQANDWVSRSHNAAFAHDVLQLLDQHAEREREAQRYFKRLERLTHAVMLQAKQLVQITTE